MLYIDFYRRGRQEAREWFDVGNQPWRVELDAFDAYNSWRDALNDHGHVSYWGVVHIREMCWYWMGVLREARDHTRMLASK